MAKGGNRKLVLILDDEPEYLRWVEEFLASKGLQTQFVMTLPDALRAVSTRDYRLLLIDMNVPGTEVLESAVRAQHPLVLKYPGLALAIEARNLGYGAHSVIGYTVHDDDAAEEELGRLNCRYVLKGRPEMLKKVIVSSLAPPQLKVRSGVEAVRPPRRSKR